MAMFGYDVYIMLHLAGAFAVAMAYGGLGMWAMNEKEMGENRFKKLGVIAHGAGLLAIIVGGFGMRSLGRLIVSSLTIGVICMFFVGRGLITAWLGLPMKWFMLKKAGNEPAASE